MNDSFRDVTVSGLAQSAKMTCLCSVINELNEERRSHLGRTKGHEAHGNGSFYNDFFDS